MRHQPDTPNNGVGAATQEAGPFIYRQYSAGGAFCIDMFPPAGDVPAYGRCQRRNSGKALWYVNWYSSGVALTDDGEYLVQYGQFIGARSGQLDKDPPVISFHYRSKLIKQYTLDDLQKKEKSGVPATKPDTPERLRLVGAEGFKDGGKLFEACLSNGTLLTFDVRTGEITARGSTGPVPGGQDPVCRGYHQVRLARSVASGFTRFAQRLYADLAPASKGQNVILSPSDLGANLLLASTGARGKTEEQLRALLLPGWRCDSRDGLIEALAALDEAAGIENPTHGADWGRQLLLGLKVVARNGDGLTVESLSTDSPFQELLRPGDRIQKIGNKPAVRVADLDAAVVNGARALDLTVVRPGSPRSPLTVSLPLRPPTLLESSVSLWVGQRTAILPEFEARLKRFRPGVVQQIDFKDPAGAARKINRAVARATRNTIDQLVDPLALGGETQVLLASATYLSAPWKLPLDRLPTPQPFSLAPERSVNVPMMRNTDAYRLLQKVDFDLLELPFQGDRLSMLVLLPDVNTTLEEAETLLTTEDLGGCLDELDGTRRRTVEVTLPLFEIKGKRLSLSETLGRLGVQAALSDREADFSGLSGAPKLKLAQVNHQAFIKVDEQGVVAAAASGSSFQPRAGDDRRIRKFQADRPFLFLIRDRASNAVLFLGRAVDPTKES